MLTNPVYAGAYAFGRRTATARRTCSPVAAVVATDIAGAGDQNVYSGATADSTTDDGGVQVVYGTANATTISGSFATQFVYGSATATLVGFESYEYIEPGGADSGTILGNGGQDVIYASGVTLGSEVQSGGNQYVYGSAIDTTVDTTGVQTSSSAAQRLRPSSGVPVSNTFRPEAQRPTRR